MTIHAGLYRSTTGVALVPGTLNVVLDSPWCVGPGALRLEPPEYPVPLSLVPCRIEGIDGFVVRTDKNDRGEGDHPRTVLEIAAPLRLRQVLGLADGDTVVVAIDDGHCGRA